jgi:predicted DsbA family dithiol-disulfide isomerase
VVRRTIENMSAHTPTSTPSIPPIRVEIWSDVVCPWCYIGKRRFERAVDELAGEIELEVSYRPYQLDPTASPGKSEPVATAYANKFGGPERASQIIDHVTGVAAEDGLEFRLDRALRANTLLAHRLLWWAEQPGSPVAQADVKERLLRAYFMEGLDISDADVLADCIAELGVGRAAVLDVLESDQGLADVRSDLERAADLGISAVPTFVVNGQWAIPGAQDTETFVNVLRRLRDRMSPTPTPTPTPAHGGDVCADDACDV